MTSTPAIAARRTAGRFLAAFGLATAALGVCAYIVQMVARALFLPWYLPSQATGTLAAVLLLVALWRRATAWRVVAAFGVFAYLTQLLADGVFAPLYLAASGTLAALLLVAALWRRFTPWRMVALLPVVLLATGEWVMTGESTIAYLQSVRFYPPDRPGLRLPAYTGPVLVGESFPEFATTLSNGTPLTQRDLQGEQDTELVFFRGRW